MPSLYIITGCNGAGKTTASFTVLPELLNIREFVNADVAGNTHPAALNGQNLLI
jgi:predicted ABC-type ATPase